MVHLESFIWGNFSYSSSTSKTQYHPSQPQKSGKSFNCPVFTFPSFTAMTIHRRAVFSIIQQPISNEDQHSRVFWIGNLKGKLIFQHHLMNRWHSSELQAVFQVLNSSWNMVLLPPIKPAIKIIYIF